MSLETDIRDIILVRGHNGLPDVMQLIKKAFTEQMNKRPSTITEHLYTCDICKKSQPTSPEAVKENQDTEFELFRNKFLKYQTHKTLVRTVLDQDLYPHGLELVVDLMQSIPDPSFGFTSKQLFDGIDRLISAGGARAERKVRIVVGLIKMDRYDVDRLIDDMIAMGHAQDSKLRAVKYVKDATGLGLKDAKELCDANWHRFPKKIK